MQARNIELEQQLIDKIRANGQLTQDGIDKDAALRTQKYNMETMQSRLDSYEVMVSTPEEHKSNARIKRKGDSDTESHKEDDDKLDADKKQVVSAQIEQELEDIKSKSTTNGNGGSATEEIKQ